MEDIKEVRALFLNRFYIFREGKEVRAANQSGMLLHLKTPPKNDYFPASTTSQRVDELTSKLMQGAYKKRAVLCK
jgi:hypothetical protein